MYFTGKSRIPPAKYRATHSGIDFWYGFDTEDQLEITLAHWHRRGKVGIRSEQVKAAA